MEVVFFHRKPRGNAHFSVEFIFGTLRSFLGDKIVSRVEECSYLSNGLLRRIVITIEAAFRQGEINHVTGDINFLNFFFRKRRSVLTILDCAFMDNAKGIKRWIFRIFWLVIPVHRARIVTVISQATKDELLKYVNCDPDKIRVVPVFVSESFVPGEGRPFNTERPILLQVGTAPNKNLIRLIEAVKEIDCCLDIIGELSDEQQEALRKYDVKYVNSVRISDEEMVEKYQNCDLVTFVSTYEGFGMPIIEANCVEKPVITSDILSMPEVAGDAACIVDPFNISQIKDGVLKIIEDANYRNELIDNGKKNKLRYSIGAIANMYVDVYNEVLN